MCGNRWFVGMGSDNLCLVPAIGQTQCRSSDDYLARCPVEGVPTGADMLEEADFASHRFDQLRWVVPDPLLEHDLHVSHVADARRRITRDYHEIRVLSYIDRARTTGASEKCRA